MKRSVVVPVILAVYLCVMAYIGRARFCGDDRLLYFILFGITALCIVALHFNLRRRERRNGK
ncbi:MAG: hypothetical protein K2K79_02810 [Paramuribaculum sp.]|nr:hypothetical protein [Paramuribaculum sp.]